MTVKGNKLLLLLILGYYGHFNQSSYLHSNYLWLMKSPSQFIKRFPYYLLECSLERGQRGDNSPHFREETWRLREVGRVGRGCPAQRGWVGWPRLPSWSQREPALRRAPPSSCLQFWALIPFPGRQHQAFLQPFLPWERSSYLISVLSTASRTWTPLASACVTTGKRLCFSEPQSSRLWDRYEPAAPQAARGLKCKAENTLWTAEHFRERKRPLFSSDSVGLLRAPSLERHSFTQGAK